MSRSLALVGLRRAGRTPPCARLATAWIDDGWKVTVVATPSGQGWLVDRRIEEAPARYRCDYRRPDEPKGDGDPGRRPRGGRAPVGHPWPPCSSWWRTQP